MASVCDKEHYLEHQLFLCLHCGAGAFAKDKYKQYKQVMKNACNIANIEFKKTKCVRTAVVAATEYLENSPLVNAGLSGSSVTINGTIECDAGILNVNTQKWAAITSVSTIKNPICAAEALHLKSQQPLSNGRISPIFLCGPAAQHWCQENNVATNNAYKLSSTQQSLFDEYSKQISLANHANDSEIEKRKLCDTDSRTDDGFIAPPLKKRKLSDLARNKHGTCGVIGFDIDSKVMYVSCSSGGIWMKNEGRIGPSAVIGAGFDGKEVEINDIETVRIGCCASGSGEYLMQYRLSQQCCDALIEFEKSKDAADSGDSDDIMDENVLCDVFDRFRNMDRCAPAYGYGYGGCLIMKVVENDMSGMGININWAHTTDVMGVAVLCDGAVKTYMSCDDNIKVRNRIVISGYHCNINAEDIRKSAGKSAETIVAKKKNDLSGESRRNEEDKVENVEGVENEMNGMEILDREWNNGDEVEYDSDQNGSVSSESHVHKAKLVAINDGSNVNKNVVKDVTGNYCAINIELCDKSGKHTDGDSNHNNNNNETDGEGEMRDNNEFLMNYEIDQSVIDKYPSDLPSFMIDSQINQVD